MLLEKLILNLYIKGTYLGIQIVKIINVFGAEMSGIVLEGRLT